MPLLAAAAGMIVPAGVYWGAALASGHPELARGWAIPCATDIAFSYLVARLIFPARHPAIPFLLLLAVADDALGLLVLALFYPAGAVSPLLFVLLMLPALAIAWGLHRRQVRSLLAVHARRRDPSPGPPCISAACIPRWRSCPSCPSCVTKSSITSCSTRPTSARRIR